MIDIHAMTQPTHQGITPHRADSSGIHEPNMATTRFRMASAEELTCFVDTAMNHPTKNQILYIADLSLGAQAMQLLLLPATFLSASGTNGNSRWFRPENDAKMLPQSQRTIPCTKDIVSNVQQALKDFYSIPKLSKNPLTENLNLTCYRNQDDTVIYADALALQRALNEAIDNVSAAGVNADSPSNRWRVGNYLHLRYREELQHKDIAVQLGYTERHLHRLRKELIADLAELLCAL